MRKNNVQVHRGEVDVQLGHGEDDDVEEGSLKAYSFPDPQSLALKYGLVNGNVPLFTYLVIYFQIWPSY